ncbi:putative membrane protein [Halovivax ruber XH-70]|uniref:Putative membrane protein n=1 Tax=Halovivax ruber (strain DSM 18193 / JCM 13892 / XH-70) TaxID=797302 RepID=L0I8X1_HALRX|nr:DUF1616 domain-containing protein [Halovivax ruber]AGB15253.1 putative membrane protein [Halovivax ruber XH-70]
MSDQIADLKLLAALTVVAVVVIVSGVGSGTPVSVLIAIPLLLFVPGYAVLAALLPSSERTVSPLMTRIFRLEWWLLSVSLSLVVVSIVAILVVLAPLEFGPVAVASLLGIVSGVAMVVAARRRKRVHVGDRHESDSSLVAPIRGAFRTNSRVDVVLSVALFASLLLLAASGFYALSVEPHQSDYTELYVLAENDTAEYVVGGYPTEIESGEELTLSVGVENHEGAAQEYTVIAQEQRLDGGDVAERSELDRFSFRLQDGETDVTAHTVEPSTEDGSVEIVYLLFRTDADDIPATPTEADAYRRAFVGLEVRPTVS